MRAPQIIVRTHEESPRLKVKTRNGSSLCKCKICQEDLCYATYQGYNRLTRSVTKWMRHIKDVIIYETYRCMPLIGDETVQAPNWEEHIVRYHIVIVIDG